MQRLEIPLTPQNQQFISLYTGTPLDQQDFNMMSRHAWLHMYGVEHCHFKHWKCNKKAACNIVLRKRLISVM